MQTQETPRNRKDMVKKAGRFRSINKNTLVCLTEARTKSAQFRAPPQCGSHR